MFALRPWTEGRAARTLMPRSESPFRMLREEFEPVFERYFGRWPMELAEPWIYPRGLTMEEGEKEIVVRAELPGFEPGEVEVLLRGAELIIEAKHGEEPNRKEGKKVPKEEHPYAHLRRVITLPEQLDLEKMEAVYRNGVLEVRVPRLPEATGRRIDVKV